MFAIDILPGLVLGIREGLEAFLIISIMLEYLNKTNRKKDKKFVFQGLFLGLLISFIFGVLLFVISNFIQSGNSNISKLWEFAASFIALILITTFLISMIKSSKSFSSEIKDKMSHRFSRKTITLLATVMVAREGAEVVLFTIASADQVYYSIGAVLGVLMSGILSYLIYKSLFKVNLKLIFNITIIYLILQAGFMLGYSFHELFSYFKAENMISSSHWIFNQMFNVSHTFLDHKSKPVGIILYATVGWYSKPEVFQFIIQYAYTITFMVVFIRFSKNKTDIIN